MSIGGADLSVQGRIEIGVISHGMEAAAQSLKTVQVQAEAAGKSLRSAGESFAAVGQKAKGIGQSLTVGVTAPLVGLAGIAVNAASDLSESMSAVNTIFGDSAKAVVDFSKTSADALGLSQQQTLQAATQFGALFEATGSSAAQAAEFSQNLIGASADLASFYNVAGGAAQVSEQFRAALTGEGDALKQYGIIINEASVNQELVRLGQDKLTGSALEAAKVQARYNLVLKEMGAAQGDFARTSDGLANKTRIARAELTNAAAEIGTQLLPLVLRAVNVFSRLIKRFEQVPTSTKRIIVGLLAVAAAVGPLLIVFGSIASAIGSLLPVFGLLLGPLGLIIAALVALGIAYKTNFLGFGDAIRSVGGILRTFVNYIQAVNADGDILNDWLSHLPGPLQAVARLFGRLLNAVKKIGSGFKEMFQAISRGDFTTAFAKLRKVLAGIGDFLSAPEKAIGEFLKSISTGVGPLDAVIHRLGSIFITFGRLVQEIFQGDWSGALVVAKRLLGQFGTFADSVFTLLVTTIRGAFNALTAFLGGIDWRNVATTIVGALGGVGDAIWDTLLTAVKRVDWGNLWDEVVSAVTEAAATGIDITGAVIDGVLALGPTLQTVADDFVGWLTSELRVVKDAVIPAGDITVEGKIELHDQSGDDTKPSKDLVQRVLDGIVATAATVHRVGILIGTYIFQGLGLAVGAAAGLLTTGVVLLIAGIVAAIKDPSQIAKIGVAINTALRLALNVTAWSFGGLGRLISAFYGSIKTAFDATTPDLSAIPDAIGRAISADPRALYNAGYDLISGLLAGMSDRVNQLLHWLGGLPDWIRGSVGNPFNWLFNAGWDAMRGLASGIYSGFKDNVVGALKWVTENIPAWKGPRAKDLALLYDSGQVVMQGFEAGLLAGFAGVKSTLGTMTQQLAPALTAAPPPRLASVSTARTVQAGGVTINVSGAGDPEAVAQAVYRSLDAAFGRLELEVRR